MLSPVENKWVWRGRSRLTELPYPRFLGFWVWFVKSFEVIFFKLLEVLDLYRPQKSIVGIPGLATMNFTSLQAVVYNGTQEEVLGFKPRRLLHRLLKGLPDTEFFEKIRFQIPFSEHNTRSVEASTETRGFIQLHIPWEIPWHAPLTSWLRIAPLGVETFFGRIQLGDYEVLSCPIFYLKDEIRWIVISDIDDTIKDSRIQHTTGFRKIVRHVFRGHFYSYDAVSGMAEIYQDLAKKGALIVYVTSTPFQLAPFLLKFLRDRNFPLGPVFPRWLGYGRFGHKWRVLHRILSNLERQKCLLIGDSGEQDLQIYRRICETELFARRVERILIRHIPGSDLPKAASHKECFYNDISELKTTLDEIVVV